MRRFGITGWRTESGRARSVNCALYLENRRGCWESWNSDVMVVRGLREGVLYGVWIVLAQLLRRDGSGGCAMPALTYVIQQ